MCVCVCVGKVILIVSKVVEDGYEFFNDRTLVTVFSAPNYCGEFDNYGAIMTISNDLLCSFELLAPEDKLNNKRVDKNR